MIDGVSLTLRNKVPAAKGRLRNEGELWLLTAALILWYGRAIQGGIFPDVAIFARSSAAMLDGYLYGNPTHSHAPIARYAMALSQAIFGTTSFAIKLPSVVFAISTVVLTYRIGRFVFTRKVGFVAAVLLAGNAMFTRWTATGFLDVTLAFMVSALIYTILYWDDARLDNHQYTKALGALLVIVPATMLQGAVFAFAGGIAVIYSVVRRDANKRQLLIVGRELTFGMVAAFVVIYTPFLFSPHPEYYGGYQIPKLVESVFAIPLLSNIIYAFGESAVHNLGHISTGHTTEVAGRTYQQPPFWTFGYWMITGSGLLPAIGYAGLAWVGWIRNSYSHSLIIAILTVIPLLITSSISVKDPNYMLPLFPVLVVWAIGALGSILFRGINRISQRNNLYQVTTGLIAVCVVVSVAVVTPTTVGPVQSDSGMDETSEWIAEYANEREEPVRVAAATPLPIWWYLGDKKTETYSFEAESIRYFDLDEDGKTEIILSGGYQNETIQQRMLSDLRNGSLCLAVEIPGQTPSPLSGHFENATTAAEFPRTAKGERVVIYQFPSNCPSEP